MSETENERTPVLETHTWHREAMHPHRGRIIEEVEFHHDCRAHTVALRVRGFDRILGRSAVVSLNLSAAELAEISCVTLALAERAESASEESS